MSEERNQAVVERLWQLMDARDFVGVGALLHDDFICDWPQTNERIRGRDNFVAINAAYPGEWRITIEQILCRGDQVVTDVIMEWERQIERVVSFFEVRDGLIMKEIDYFPQPYDAPSWRYRWVERII
jgi:ketosteroid isomerase-like protein